jgi:hypothetical protein
MKFKLSAAQRRRLLKLLYMPYTPEELAGETGIPVEAIARACAAGCPHEINESGTWMVGTDFQQWLGIRVANSHKRPNGRGLIHRENYREVKDFLDYRTQVLQLDPQSIRSRWIELRHILENGPVPGG